MQRNYSIMSIIELRVVRSQLARPASFSPYSSKLFANDSLLFQCASASSSNGIAAVWYVCTAMVVCRRIGLVEEDDDDVEIIVEVSQGQAERAFKDETPRLATSTRMPSAARPRADSSTLHKGGSTGLSRAQ